MSRRTIARPVDGQGTGLHTGAAVRFRLAPGAPGGGILFHRADHPASPPIPASLDRVVATERRTALAHGGQRVESVEHLLAAVAALEIDDLRVLVEGPELPILDGSFAPFVALLTGAGSREQPGAPHRIELRSTLSVEDGEAHYRVEPGHRLELEVTLEYAAPVIGHQTATLTVTPEGFRREIAPARTYGFLDEVETLRDRGLLAGATAEAALVLAPDRVIHGTPRWPDEFARHKLGDLLGDLALLGGRLAARVYARRPSHRGNLACARAIARAADLWEVKR